MKHLKFITISLFSIVLLTTACNTSKKASQASPSGAAQQLTPFEGKVTYDIKIEDKTGEMTNEETKMLMGDKQIFIMKGDKYKSEMNGMIQMTQIYLGGDTLYNQMKGMKSILWIDVRSASDKMIDYTIQKEAETIAGIKCDLLTIRSEQGTTKYYFNKKYYVNPASFQNHEYGFWKFCIEQTNTIPIKSILDDNEMYLEITAKEIKEMKIDDAEFDVPNLPRVVSPE
jgi:hypothetical protein